MGKGSWYRMQEGIQGSLGKKVAGVGVISTFLPATPLTLWKGCKGNHVTVGQCNHCKCEPVDKCLDPNYMGALGQSKSSRIGDWYHLFSAIITLNGHGISGH